MIMKYKRDPGRIKIYLASRMDNPFFRERRLAIISYFERSEFFSIINFERGAGEDRIDKEMEDDMRDSHMAIILLEGDLRTAVEKEYNFAMKHGKPMLIYIDGSRRKKPKLKDFIKAIDIEKKFKPFNDIGTLVDTIENDLSERLVKRFVDYIKLEKENEYLTKKPERLKGTGEEVPYPGEKLFTGDEV